MIQTLLSLILIVVACCGCETTTGDPKATSQNTEHEANEPTATAVDAEASVVAHNNDNGTGDRWSRQSF